MLFLAFSCNAFPQTLHAVLASDVEDPVLGGISLRDEETILQILKTAEWGTGLKLKTYYYNRADFTAKAVREALSKMPVGPKDVVFFYYTGLGYYPGQNDMFPTFKLKENALKLLSSDNLPLSLEEVGDILQKKSARLNVVMADCRDTVEDLEIRAGSTGPDEDMRGVFLKKLFLGSCGLVKAASARRGEKVWVNARENVSVYTQEFSSYFSSLLRSNFYGVRQATWPQVLPTKSITISSENPDTYQTPLLEIKSCSASQRQMTTSYASYKNSVTVGGIANRLNRYVRYGEDYQILRNEISRAFLKNAQIELIRRNKYPESHPKAKRTVEHMSVDQFLTQFREVASKIVEVNPDMTSVKRTPNKEYITSLTIIEEFEEL